MIDYETQAKRLIETGACDLPITREDVSARCAKHPEYTLALFKAANGQSQLLSLLVEVTTIIMCKEIAQSIEKEKNFE